MQNENSSQQAGDNINQNPRSQHEGAKLLYEDEKYEVFLISTLQTEKDLMPEVSIIPLLN